MKRMLGVVALGIVAACNNSTELPSDPPPAPTEATTSQLRAFDTLQITTKQSWTWLQHETLKTPMHLSAARTGAPLLQAGISAEQATISFVDRYRDLFQMKSAPAELRLTKNEHDTLSMTHVRFQQVFRDVPVAGAELMAHYDGAGRLTSIDANYIPGIDLDVTPTVAASAALATAKGEVGIDDRRLSVSEPKLVIDADERAPTLAYQTTVRAVFGKEPAIWVITVDAKTGAVLSRHNNLQTVQGTGIGVLGDTKKLQVTQSGSGYVMSDTSRGVSINTYNAKSQEVGPDQGATAVTSSTLASWDATGTARGAAVDAHFFAGVVFDYYKTVHDRNAIDGAGGTMLSTAHFGQQYDNAFWDGYGMSYGDGGQMFKPLSAGLDVCGHEFTHGVTQNTSNLNYHGQSGALNESVSDIFGAMIEHSLYPDPTNNWIMGEKIVLEEGLLRDFKNPANGNQPAAMSQYVNTQQDEGGVHTNSGIPNNAAYLMTMGGTNPKTKTAVAFGIGWDKAGALWYRANTKYFMTTTNFAQAAQGVMSAAKDIGLTENEQNIVDCAWKAVGVVQGTCGTITDPSIQTTPPPTSDTTETPTPDPSAGSTPDESGDDTTPAKAPTTTTTTTSSGCSAAPGRSSETGLGLFAAVAVTLGLSRRRRC